MWGYFAELVIKKRRDHDTDVTDVSASAVTTLDASGATEDMTGARFVRIRAIDTDILFTVGTVANPPADPTAGSDCVLSGTKEWVRIPVTGPTDVPRLKLKANSADGTAAIIWGL